MENLDRILVIGDLHAPKSFGGVDGLIHRIDPRQIILLGDYLDHFQDEPRDAARMGAWLRARLDDPRFTFLLGNHDLPYLFPGRITCPGFSYEKAAAFHGALDMEVFRKTAKLAHWLDRSTLLTHSGLSRRGIPSGFAVEALPVWLNREIRRAWKDLEVSDGWPRHWIWRAGFARGGDQAVGGLLWCDLDEFAPVAKLSQIFGHTPARKIRRIETGDGTVNICVDTCDAHGGGPREALVYEGGSWRAVSL